MKTVTVEQMRNLDVRTINEAGIPGAVLMETAGVGAAEHIIDYASSLYPKHVKRFVILAGKGNNGGDGYVVAKFLLENHHAEVVIYAICSPKELSGDAKLHADLIKDTIPAFVDKKPQFQKGDIIIDALLGTGTKGALRAPYDAWIAAVNVANMPVIALDIPSGLNGDDGTVATESVIADITITMGLPKCGMLLNKGPELCGQVKCVDIGIPVNYIAEIKSDIDMIFEQDINCLNRRPANSYKNKNGSLLVIAGSRSYPGAPFLTAKAAMRSGAGLVTVAVPQSAYISLPSMHSLIVRRISDAGTGIFSEESADELNQLIASSDAIAIGPGITTEDEVIEMLDAIIDIDKAVVWDADALNILTTNQSLIDRESATVLTPHPGEMQRLLKGFNLISAMEAERITQAVALAEKTRAVTVLKGHNSVIASPGKPATINSSGSASLATAGSGDVLTGIIGALLAQGFNAFDSARFAVFIHGLAGEQTPLGIRGLTADDLIDLIPVAMQQISPFA
jgi:ADP-dependent NAD(P)H-hydrate dehydratase / NAD(P)H-hydrate epimerase